EPRPELAFAMPAPRREHQQCFSDRRHRLVQQHGAQAFAERRAARLARDPDAPAVALERLLEPRQMRALAGSVDAFEGYETAALARVGHGSAAFWRVEEANARSSGILPLRDCDRRDSAKTRLIARHGGRSHDTA